MQRVPDKAPQRRSCTRCTLRQLCLPADADAEARRALEELVTGHRDLGRGTRLFQRGEPLGAVYVVRDGTLKTVTIPQDGDEQVMGFHLPGEIVGLDALATGLHRVDAVTLASARVCEVPFEALVGFAARSPRIHQRLLQVIGQVAARDQDHAEMLIRRQANERLALFLCSLADRYRRAGQSGTRLLLPMSREDIGRYLGLALETVSRGFSRLQDDGVVKVAGRHIELLNLAALRQLAHHG